MTRLDHAAPLALRSPLAPITLLRQTAARFATALTLGLALTSCGGADEPPSFAVGGAVQQPRTYARTDLLALPATTQTVTFTSAGVAQTHTYTGTSLQGVLDASVINVDAAVKNDFLNDYVLATGADGYRAVFAIGELRSDFGNRLSLVAYAETTGGVSNPLVDDGFARITSPGDVKGGRYVSNLVRLDVRASGSTPASTAGGTSTQFAVSGAVTTPMTFDLAALQALPQVTRTVGANTYTGPTLWSLLTTTVGLKTDATLKNPTLAMYVVATGSDGYRALLSLGELDPGFGNQPDIVAVQVNGAGLGANGFARLVVPNDVKAGRWVSNLVKLEVYVAPAAP